MNRYPEYPPHQNEAEEAVMLPQTPPKARLHTGIIVFAIALGEVVALLVQLIIQTLITSYYPAITENDWFMWAISTFPIYLVAMPISYLLFLTVPKSVPQKKKLTLPMWFGFLFFCFGVSYFFKYLGQYVIDWIYVLLGVEVKDQAAEIAYITPFGINLLFVGILGPIFEELFFRKAVIDRLRRYGDLPAILISGLIFGLIHGNFSQLFYTAAIGMVLGFVYLRTGNVLYTIALHCVFNIIGGVYVTEMLRYAESDIGIVMTLAYGLFVILSFVVGAIFLIANIRRFCCSLQKGEYSLTFDQWMNALVFNPGMWAFLAWMALMFLSSLLEAALA